MTTLLMKSPQSSHAVAMAQTQSDRAYDNRLCSFCNSMCEDRKWLVGRCSTKAVGHAQ